MFNRFAEHVPVLAALYHESGRTSVAVGDTLAHTAGQARPFTEFGDLPADALEGRLMTAENIARRVRFTSARGEAPSCSDDVERFAIIIHECEREAIEAGKVVVKLNPPRPWIPFGELPPPAQAGRRRQAAFFLARFVVEVEVVSPVGS